MKTLKSILPIIIVLLIELATGILLLWNAELFTEIILRVFGASLIIIALFYIIKFIVLKVKKEEAGVFPVILSVIALAVGIFAAFFPHVIMNAIVTFTLIVHAVVMIISGVIKINLYIDTKREGFKMSKFVLIGALVTLILGIVFGVLAFLPNLAFNVFATIAGIVLIIDAVFDIVSLVMTFVERKKAAA